MGVVVWHDSAIEDLHQTSTAEVERELLDLAERELVVPDDNNDLEGRLERWPNVFRRRGIRRAAFTPQISWDLGGPEEEGDQAHDYVLLYRKLKPDDKISLRRSSDGFLVVRVLHNRRFARLYGDS